MSSVLRIFPYIPYVGNEGHGIRTNILRRCDTLVKIPSMIPLSTRGVSNPIASSESTSATGTSGIEDGSSTAGGSSQDEDAVNGEVDSLNVSVSGGIILHHILSTSTKLKLDSIA